MDTSATLPSGTVTFLFTDIEGSTRLLRDLGGSYTEVLALHDEILRTIWASRGGHEMGTEGDSFFVAFDDAHAALAAASDAQRAVADSDRLQASGLRIRIGVHTGLASPIDGQYRALSVHQASRVAACARGGQTYTTDDTLERCPRVPTGYTTRVLGRFRVRDFDEPVRLHLVVPSGTEPVDSAPRVRPADHHNLVHPTSDLIDRDDERAVLRQALRPGRLTTITGPGGVGKTRLAIEIALESPDRWRDGMWFIDLSAIHSSEDVPSAIADGLGLALSPAEERWSAVLHGIGPLELLLILDNAEQFDDTFTTMVGELLASCPSTALLVTSRTPLHLRGEEVVHLRGLSAEAPDAPALELLRRCVGPRAATFDEHDAIELCSALDGLPVAIEVASRQLAVSTPGELIEQLRSGGGLPAAVDPTLPDRHHSLERLIERSETMLSPAALSLLRRLSVIASTFALETAAALRDSPTSRGELIELMLELVDGSLVDTVAVDGTSRYRLLETVRQYERSMLDDDEALAAVRMHAAALVDRVGPQRPLDRAWVGAMALELDNVRHAADLLLRSGDRDDLAVALTLVCGVVQFQDRRDSFRAGIDEAARWYRRTEGCLPERTMLLTQLADLHLRIGQLDQAATAIAEAVEMEEESGLPMWDQVALVRSRGELALRRGKPRETRRLVRETLMGDLNQRERARLLSLLGIAYYELGELDNAASTIHAEIDAAVAAGMETYLVNAHGNLAEALMQLGDHRGAAHHELRCAELRESDGDDVQQGFYLMMAAQLAAVEQRWSDAVTLQAAADRVLSTSGYELYEQDRKRRESLLAEASDSLGDEGVADATADAERISLPELAEFATELLISISSAQALPRSLTASFVRQTT